MYEAFYGLKEKPFNLTPDPRFLYLSEKHREAFAHLLFGIKNRGGFVMVTGEIGTGKTTICRTLLNKLDPDTEVAFIFNPCLSPEELLRTINEDFGIESRATTIKGLIDELNVYLLERRALNKNCVLVIDEAQNLAPAVLEQIRLLSNLETEKEKLLQIVLIGQPELGQMLALPELRQLNQRITARYHLRELDRDETLQYIAYRLRVAGGRRKVRFTRRAVRTVYRQSKGVPRVINAICDRTLLVGYTIERREITAALVRRAAREVRGESHAIPQKSSGRRVLRPLAAAAALALIGAGTYVAAPHVEDFALRRLSALGESVAQAAPSRELEPRSEGQSPADAALPGETANPAAAVPAEAAAKSAQDYQSILYALDPAASRDAAAEAILRRWDRKLLNLPQSNADADIVGWASAHGLQAEILQPTLENLMAIDLPAFAMILGPNEPLWIGIVGKHGEELEVVVAPDRTEWIPRTVLDPGPYMLKAIVPWTDNSPGAGTLTESARGEAVLALQTQLAALGRLRGEPTGIYDASTVTAIRLIQHETGLDVDGKVGRQTRMVLSSWSPENAMARLSSASYPPAQPEIALAAATPPAAPASTPPAEAPPAEPAPSVMDTAVESAPEPVADAPAQPAAATPGAEPVSETPAPPAEAAPPADLPAEAPATAPAAAEMALADELAEAVKSDVPAIPLAPASDGPVPTGTADVNFLDGQWSYLQLEPGVGQPYPTMLPEPANTTGVAEPAP